ncbi:MAG: hypothetical protein HQK96_14315 [Nitrospirae bacterium]|nr:hypothetical protein [Nitrospirota bacterium]
MQNYNDYVVGQLKEFDDAVLYLKIAIEEYEKDKNKEAMLIAIDHVVKAQK